MAAETIGVIASIITVAGVAIKSTKELYETIETSIHANKDVKSFGTEVNTVQKILTTLEATLQRTSEDSTSGSLQQCLRDFEPTMRGLSKLCIEAKGRFLRDIGDRPSTSMGTRDKVKFIFKEKAVLAYRYQLASYKVTINIIIGLATLITSNDDRQVIEDLQSNITVALSKITGQIEGLEISRQSTLPMEDAKLEFTAANDSDSVLYELGQCLKVSQSAVDAAPPRVRYSIGKLDVSTDARQWVSITQGKPGLVDTAVARDRGQQLIQDTAFSDEMLMAMVAGISGGARRE